jgi:Uma2 family endonuclease
MVLININPPFAPEEISRNLDIDEIKFPPTDLESDEPPLESDLHRRQIDLLIRLLEYWYRDRPDIYISGNLTIYYNEQQLKSRDFRGPDVFIVLDTEKKDRKSWVIWNEGGKYPNVVIELLSSSTAKVDRTIKKELYQNVWRVPNYFWFDPYTLEFAGFHIVDGKYEAIAPKAFIKKSEQGYLWSDQLELYLGIHANQLRWFTSDGELIPTAEERADRLEGILRSQGIENI